MMVAPDQGQWGKPCVYVLQNQGNSNLLGFQQSANPILLHENFGSRFQGGGTGLKGGESGFPDFLSTFKFQTSRGMGGG